MEAPASPLTPTAFGAHGCGRPLLVTDWNNHRLAAVSLTSEPGSGVPFPAGHLPSEPSAAATDEVEAYHDAVVAPVESWRFTARFQTSAKLSASACGSALTTAHRWPEWGRIDGQSGGQPWRADV